MAAFSTPSATVRMPSALASWKVEDTIIRLRWSVVMAAMKERSTLSSCTGRSRRYDNEEKPVP